MDLSKNVNLNGLTCTNNELTTLDLTHNPQLDSLICAENLLKELNLSNCNIVKLWIVGNAIPYVNLSQDFTDGTSNWFDNHDETQAITIAGNSPRS